MDKILVIDDDTELCTLLTDYLGAEGFEISAVHDGESGVREALATEPALVVLDVMLPKLNGFDALKKIRTASTVPVIMLTARRDDVDRIVGLELGADDYLPKPFNPRELVARIRAVLRRLQPEKVETPRDHLIVGDVEMDRGSQSVRCNGEAVRLTAAEFTLLELFLTNAGKVKSREELSAKVLGRNLTRFDRSIDVHVSNLRKKLGHYVGNVERIRTVRSRGYLYAKSGAADPTGADFDPTSANAEGLGSADGTDSAIEAADTDKE